jgi:hypothetical protein
MIFMESPGWTRGCGRRSLSRRILADRPGAATCHFRQRAHAEPMRVAIVLAIHEILIETRTPRP